MIFHMYENLHHTITFFIQFSYFSLGSEKQKKLVYICMHVNSVKYSNMIKLSLSSNLVYLFQGLPAQPLRRSLLIVRSAKMGSDETTKGRFNLYNGTTVRLHILFQFVLANKIVFHIHTELCDKMLPPVGIEPRPVIASDSKSNAILSTLTWHVLLRRSLNFCSCTT